jgi:1-acyl-sn-glycerol-3-phosphate acyltransferase
MRRVFAALYWVFFGVSSLVFFVLALLVWVVTAPFDPDRRVNHLFSCLWSSLYGYAYPGWRLRVHGRRLIRPRTPYVLVANHTSGADIVLCFALFKQFKWVSKDSMFRVPLIGWNMRLCRYVPLVRGSAASIAAMWRQCHAWLARGISIMMFPEGTRSPDGRLREFKHGAFTLAREAGVPVVPVVIHGGHEIMPKDRTSFAPTAELDIEVLEPIPSTAFADLDELRQEVWNRINARLATGRPGQRRRVPPPDAAEHHEA